MTSGDIIKKPRCSTSVVLVALGIAAAACLGMVVTVGVLGFGGSSAPSSGSDSSQANVGQSPTVAPGETNGQAVSGIVPTNENPYENNVLNSIPTLQPTAETLATLEPVRKPSLRPTMGSVPAPETANVVPVPQPTLPLAQPTNPAIITYPLSYKPGDLSVESKGLKLSTGLIATVIAESDAKVKFTNGDETSDNDFISNPDGGAVVATNDGWIYLIDSDRGNERGSVAALTFNNDGEVVDYNVVSKSTNANKNGATTPWGTYLTMENVDEEGNIFEVDPKGVVERVRTVVSTHAGKASWSGAAYDNRRKSAPVFYFSADGKDGESFVVRYKPSQEAINTYLFAGPAFKLLVEDQNPTVDYLVMGIVSEGPKIGVFSWSSDRVTGMESSEEHFRSVSNVLVRDGILYLTSEAQQELFVLDLDSEEFTGESTDIGDFNGDPLSLQYLLEDDMVRRLTQRELHAGHDHGAYGSLAPDVPLLYLAEGNDESGGIHARTDAGQYVTILKDSNERGDVTSLAFGPEMKYLYFAFKTSGEVFKVERADGRSFADEALETVFIS